MKIFLKKMVLWILRRLAKRRIKNFKGKVVAVTGSVGKTSTKDAIFAILNTRMRVRRSKKSMNSEFGLPLTVLDIDSGYNSAVKWGWLLLKALYHSLMRDCSEVLLLEFGVDKPGDMKYLTSIVHPDVAVITKIAPVHLEEGQFKNVEEIFEEKSKIVEKLKENGKAIINTDDPLLVKFAKKLPSKTLISVGSDKNCDFKFSKVKSSIEGISFIAQHDHAGYEARLGVLGEQHVYMSMLAIACASLFGFDTEESLKCLENFKLPPGRMSVIEGENNSTILDSSYNASPEAVKEALKTLKDVAGKKRKIAVLGNMNELGEKSEELHAEIGVLVPNFADILLTVGSTAKLIAENAIKKGMDEKDVFSFGSAKDAADFFKKKIQKGDIILVKGSQNSVRLEIFVKEIMANPEDAPTLLVRQEAEWRKK